jgi:hypothetical protein
MDIFSRKSWCYPMKTKSLKDTTPALKKFFSESGLAAAVEGAAKRLHEGLVNQSLRQLE